MAVGVGWVDILIEDARSLKDKRKVVRSVIDRLRSRFNASVAEIGDQDVWGRAQIGFTVVSNDGRLVNSRLDQMIDAVEDMGHGRVAGSDIEILHF